MSRRSFDSMDEAGAAGTASRCNPATSPLEITSGSRYVRSARQCVRSMKGPGVSERHRQVRIRLGHETVGVLLDRDVARA